LPPLNNPASYIPSTIIATCATPFKRRLILGPKLT
jgi:hypothetical protein